MSAVPGLPAEYFMMLWAGVAVFWIALIFYAALKNRGKIMIRIKFPLEEKRVWKKPEAEMKGQKQSIIMRESKGKKVGWTVDFDNTCLVPWRDLFGRQKFALEVFPESPHAVSWNYELADVQQPKLTKQDLKEIESLRAVKTRYKEIEGGKTSMALVVIGFLVVATLILGVLNFLTNRGVRIG